MLKLKPVRGARNADGESVPGVCVTGGGELGRSMSKDPEAGELAIFRH